MYCSAKAFARLRRVARDAGRWRRCSGRRRSGAASTLTSSSSSLARRRQVQLPAHALRHFGRVGDQHFGVGFALRFAAARGRDLQRGIGQRAALEADARRRFVVLGGLVCLETPSPTHTIITPAITSQRRRNHAQRARQRFASAGFRDCSGALMRLPRAGLTASSQGHNSCAGFPPDPHRRARRCT